MNEPELTLLKRVLETAVEDATYNNPEVCGTCKLTYGECAKVWLKSDACADVCAALNIEHTYLLRKLKDIL